VGSEQYPEFEDADVTIRRSVDAIRAMEQTLGDRRRLLDAADQSLARAQRHLRDVDVDLAALDRRRAPADAPLRARVLVVDDNPSIRELLRILLDTEFDRDQVDVRCVGGGREALRCVDWAPHVAIVDWVMPEMDGLETCRRLRASLPSCRLVVYSSRLAADAEGAALDAGADRYVEKGADTDALLAEVRSAVAAADRRIRN
jgi:CheY-like chemotaxis protein